MCTILFKITNLDVLRVPRVHLAHLSYQSRNWPFVQAVFLTLFMYLVFTKLTIAFYVSIISIAGYPVFGFENGSVKTGFRLKPVLIFTDKSLLTLFMYLQSQRLHFTCQQYRLPRY